MSTIQQDIDYLVGLDRFPKRTQTPVKYPRYQITSEEYNALVGAVQKIFRSGTGQTLSGFKVLESIEDMPRTGSTLGYLIDGILYVYVGEDGDTLDGLYKNLGYLRGEKGEKGDKGDAFVFEDFTDAQIAMLMKPSLDAAREARNAAQEAQNKANQAAQEAINIASQAAQEAGEASREAREAANSVYRAIERAEEATQEAKIATQGVGDSIMAIVQRVDEELREAKAIVDSTSSFVYDAKLSAEESAANLAAVKEALDKLNAEGDEALAAQVLKNTGDIAENKTAIAEMRRLPSVLLELDDDGDLNLTIGEHSTVTGGSMDEDGNVMLDLNIL